MNFLTQIVPGLRDTRVPLAIGVLYGITLWIATPLISLVTQFGKFASDVASEWMKLPEPIAYGGGIFTIYVVGIIFEIVGRGLGNFLTDGAALLIVIIPAFFVASIVILPFTYWQVGVTVAVLLMAYHFSIWRYSKLPLGQYLSVVRSGVVSSYHQASFVFRPEAVPWSEARVIRDGLDDEIDHALRDERTARLLIDQTSTHAIARCIATRADIHAKELSQDLPPGVGLYHKLVQRMQVDADFSQRCRTVYRQRLLGERNIRLQFARRCLNLDAMLDELKRRLGRTEVALQAKQKDLYSDFDRLRAEGELRRGVSFPLGLMFAALVLRWKPYSNIPWRTLFVIAALVFLAVTLTLLFLGVHKASQAQRLVYSSYKEQLTPLAGTESIAKLLALHPGVREDYSLFADSTLWFHVRRLVLKRSVSSQLNAVSQVSSSSPTNEPSAAASSGQVPDTVMLGDN